MGTKKTFITVIIDAYGRKQFLKGAIVSALNQSLSKSKYEIIVIKNFKDRNLDSFIKKNHIKSVFSTKVKVGAFIMDALKTSKGNVISFLDDDDRFTKDKLTHVYNDFENDSRLLFYHNNYKVINETGNTINNMNDKNRYKNLKKKVFIHKLFNNSSICVRRNLLTSNLWTLRALNLSIDTLSLVLAIKNKGGIKIDDAELTFYRIHGSNSNINLIGKNALLTEFIEKKILLYKKYLEDSELFYELSIGTDFEKYFRRFSIESKFKYNIYSSINNPKMKSSVTLSDYGFLLSPPDSQSIILVLWSLFPRAIKKMLVNRLMRSRRMQVSSMQKV